jgi:sporulation protein YlmC with PRC-barrel domain
MRKLLTSISVATLLAITPALAQTGPGSPPSKSEPPSSMPDKSDSMPDKATPKSAPGAGTAAPPAKLAPASMGEHRASQMINASVKGPTGESLGTVNDLLIDDNGGIKSVILGVGGFLGIGERNVALSFDQVQFGRDANNRLVVTATVTSERLKTAPEWKDPSAVAAEKKAPTSPPKSPTSPKTQ